MFTDKQTPIQLAGVMYQIYPRSFMDSNNDGVGDIKGIISRLNYLQELGINSLWLSPIYPSPMADFGYDISDYQDIDPLFGNLDDFDKLVSGARDRNISIVMDYVANHTSDQHLWFKESRSNKQSSKRDWYIWCDPAEDGGPPNNWLSIFGGSAWELDNTTGQYYLHTFLKEQPDLNWRHPAVKEAMLDVLRFWINRGVEGFRTDAFAHIMKDKKLHNEPENPNYKKGDWEYTKLNHTLTQRLPELSTIYDYFNDVFKEYPNRNIFMVTEDYAGIDDINWHYKNSNFKRFAPLNLVFSELHWDALTIKNFINEYSLSVPTENWPNYALGNHDQPRIAGRAGDESTKIAALLQLTLRGMPIIYYGDEIGMQNVSIPSDKIHDPVSFRDPNAKNRDPQRTPMQWNASDYAGFSNAEPWLPVSDNYKEVNVEKELDNPESLLNIYRKLIKLIKQSPALLYGSYRPFVTKNESIMGYWRMKDEEEFLVLINFGSDAQEITISLEQSQLIFSSNQQFSQENLSNCIKLPAFSGIIVKC